MSTATINRRRRLCLCRMIAAVLVVLVMPKNVLAHEAGDTAGGFVSGLTHPLFGLDHVVAMIAVGLWGAQLKNPAVWLLPVTFPIVMAFGGVLGIRGVSIPAVEIGIATSAIVLGIMVAAEIKPPLWVAAIVVGAFAIFHGHAHGVELPESASPQAYGAGFVISTGLLHATGISIGILVRWPVGHKVVRLIGGCIALAGLYFLLQSINR